MELEMAIGYLVALAVPLWLLVEQTCAGGDQRNRP